MGLSLFARLRGISFVAWLGRREVGLIAALFVAAALVLGFGLLADEVVEGDTADFDHAVASAFRSAGDSNDPIGPVWLEEVGRDVTSLGSFAFLGFLSLAVASYLLLIRQVALAALMAVAVLGGMAISSLLKVGFDRPRPDVPHLARVFTASFPSGHAMLSAIVFLTLGALLARVSPDRRVKTYFVGLAVFLTVAVGVSRVYLGVHYASDVLAGWCVGAAWSLLCWTGALWLQRGKSDPPASSDG